MADSSMARTLSRWIPRAPSLPREVNFGALVMMLICLNGGIALLTVLLRRRIYDDQMIFIYIVAFVASVGTSVWWYLRSPLKGKGKTNSGPALEEPARHVHSKKKRDKKHKKHR